MLASRAQRARPFAPCVAKESSAVTLLGRGREHVPPTQTRTGSKICGRRSLKLQAKEGGSGGGVLDRPTTTPGRESEFDLGKERKTKQPKDYRVLLHNDNFNKREYVVQTLMKVIPGMTVDIAVNIMNEAHLSGMAVVIQCPQEDAENYCDSLRGSGLISSIEPASGKGGGNGDDAQ